MVAFQWYVTTWFRRHIHARWVELLFIYFFSCWHTPVEDHMMLLCCFVIFCTWFLGENPNLELNGVFVQYGSSKKRTWVRRLSETKAVKMSRQAPRQHTPPGSCCLPGAHLQIIFCGRRCQSFLSGYIKMCTLYIAPKWRFSNATAKTNGNRNNFSLKFWLTGSQIKERHF